jgi:MFS family permease
MGTVMTAHTVGFAISPAAGGYLLEHGGFAAPFLFCAALAVVNFLVIVWLAEPKHNHIEDTQDHVSRAQEDIHEDETTPLVKNKKNNKKVQLTMIDLLKNWRILSCVLCVTVSASVFSGIEPALPIHLRDTFGASASTIGCKSYSTVLCYGIDLFY